MERLTVEEYEVKLKLILTKETRGDELLYEEKEILATEYLACGKSFVRFLKYCKIVEPPVPGKAGSGGIISLELWPHILKIAKAFLTCRLIVILKSRQIGASWLCAAYDLWYALFHKGANVFLYSKGETEAWEKLDKCRRILNHLPSFLRQTPKPDSSGEMHFGKMMSTLRAFPATQTAGISFTASILDMDEWEEHPYAEANYSQAKPTIDAGGQWIGTFTVNKLKATTLAKTTFSTAWYGKSEFSALFFPYWVRPGRDEQWYQRTLEELPDEELNGLTRELYMEQAYPRSVEEALRPTRTVAVFNQDVLDRMMVDTSHRTIHVISEGLDTNICNIYKGFMVGQSLIAATDTSHGVGKDFNVTCVMNVITGEIQADIMHNLLSPEELAWHSHKLLTYFRFPLWYIEANDYGGVTIGAAKGIGYPRFGYQDDKMEKVGFLTTGAKAATGIRGTRTELWGKLVPAINNGQITIYNKQGLLQFYDIIRNAAKEGRIEAKSGRNDDYPMTVGICVLKAEEVQTTSLLGQDKPLQALTFKEGGSDNEKVINRWTRREE